MNHRMAVRACGDEVGYGVEPILRSDRTQRNDVMNVDERFGDLTLDRAKVKFTRRTYGFVVTDIGHWRTDHAVELQR